MHKFTAKTGDHPCHHLHRTSGLLDLRHPHKRQKKFGDGNESDDDEDDEDDKAKEGKEQLINGSQ